MRKSTEGIHTEDGRRRSRSAMKVALLAATFVGSVFLAMLASPGALDRVADTMSPAPVSAAPAQALPQALPLQGTQCDPPLDVVFVVDDTSSMGGAITNVQNELASILNEIEAQSAGDYQTAVVTFKDDVTVDLPFGFANRAAAEAALLALGASGGGGTPEASDEALNTVINELPARPGSDGFSGWRSDSVKVIIMVTDAEPGGFTNTFDATTIANANQRALEAAANGMLIGAVYVPTFGVDPAVALLMQNYANVTGGAYVETAADGTGTADAFIEIIQTLPVDMSVTKTAVDLLGNPIFDVNAGEELFYKITVCNNGPGDARNVVVTDTLPADIIYLDNTDNCVPAGTDPITGGIILACSLGDILCPTCQDFIIKTRVPNDYVAAEMDGVIAVLNVVDVAVDNLDTEPFNDFAENTTFIQDDADLMVMKVAEAAEVRAGDDFKYTIFVDNLGPSAARGVKIRDDIINALGLTANPTVISDRALVGGACTFSGTAPYDIVCELADELEPVGDPAGGTGRWTITITANSELEQTLTNKVTAYTGPVAGVWDAGTPDSNSSNNVAAVTTLVTGLADLELIAPCVPDPVLAGNALVCTFDVNNLGVSPAEDTRISLTVPNVFQVIGVSGVRVDGIAAGCNAGTVGDSSDPATCDFGTLGTTAGADDSGRMTLNLIVNPDAVIDPVTDSRLAQIDAVATSSTFDPDLINNFGIEQVTINAAADLRISKFAIGTPVAGEEIHYEITIHNDGPSVSRDVTLRDPLPDGIEFVSALVDLEGAAGNLPLACVVTAGSNLVLCPLGDIPPTNGVPIIVVLNVRIDPGVPNGTVLTNRADVFLTDTPDPGPGINTDDAAITVVSRAELVVEKTALPSHEWRALDPIAGTHQTYKIKVTNNGPSDAFNLLVRDTLPAGFIYDADSDACAVVSGTGAAGDPQVIECRPVGTPPPPGGVLPAGEMVMFELLVDIYPSNVGAALNTACATADNADEACGSVRVDVHREADLRITKWGKPDDEARAGDPISYTLFVDNLGPSHTETVIVTDELRSDHPFFLLGIRPDATGQFGPTTRCTYQSFDAVTRAVLATGIVTKDPATAIPAPGVLIRDGVLTITCTNPGEMQVFGPTDDPSDGPGRWIIDYSIKSNITSSLNNYAAVSGPHFDPDLTNNEALTTHSIIDVADLHVTKMDLGQTQICGGVTQQMGAVTAGKPITWTIKVGNNGPSPAENVKINDRLPNWIKVTGAQVLNAAGAVAGSCVTGMPGSALDRLMCGLDTIDPTSGTAVVNVVVTGIVDPSTPMGTILENDVDVMSDIWDPDNSNNFAHTLTTVNTRADLVITKFDDPDPVIAGEMLKYTLHVTNTGMSDAQFVVISDTLPAEVTFMGATFAQDSKVKGSCAYDKFTRQVSCMVGTLPADYFTIVDIVVMVNPDAIPTGLATVDIKNIATVRSMTVDPCPLNNMDMEFTTVNRQDKLFIEKTDTPDPVLAGAEVTYTITFGNNGPSTATNVDVRDFMPAGVTPLRCEPQDPANLVTCNINMVPGGTVILEEIKSAGAIVWEDFPPNSALNDLDPGEQYSFQIVGLVDSGYVLNGFGDTGPGEACEGLFLATGWTHFAHNQAQITSLNDIAVIDECTRVNAGADLKLDKTDIFTGDFLECDPVEPGGMVTYVITVMNQGPSDAAVVHVVDWLPAQVVHDPALVEVIVSAGEVVEIRDDGRITVKLGADDGVLGRMNVGTTETITIRAMVRWDAKCGSEMTNVAQVETRADVLGIFLPGDTPTPDTDPTNNRDIEITSIECAKVAIDKTVSYDGTCPGTNAVTTVVQGADVTFCLEITNTGTTYLDFVEIEDVISTRSMPGGMLVFTDTIRHGHDPKVPLKPGESVLRKFTVPKLDCECGIVSNRASVVSSIPTNAGRTPLPCITPATATDTADLFSPCGGADLRLELPVLNTGECETMIQIQNLGNKTSRAIVVIWGEAGACPPQAAGPLKIECTGLLKPGSAWTMTSDMLPAGSNSAIVYSLDAFSEIMSPTGNPTPFADVACGWLFNLLVGSHLDWLEFDRAFNSSRMYSRPINDFLGPLNLDFSMYRGEPLAVSVNRQCPDPVDPARSVNAAYTGVSTDQEGARDLFFGGYSYYAPMVFAEKGGLASWLWIHNSGTICTSLEIYFRSQDNCMRPILGDVLSVAPGESVHFDPSTVIGPDWLGSAWIRASQPLGVIVDTMGPNHFTSYRGLPSDTSNGWSAGSQVNYAPLIYSEYQGWDSALTVMNLDPVVAAKVKVYFMDRSGDIITTLVDWICPRGSQTFFLPVIAGIPGNWTGSARAESQEWITPGGPRVDPPHIQTVVLLEKWSDPARTERREAVAYNALTEKISFDWQIAPFTKGGLTSGVGVLAVPLLAKGNRGITSELAIANVVPKPGFTDFAIYIFDQNGYLDVICEKLGDRQVEYIDLASWGIIPPRFLGSAVISATYWDHSVFDGRGEFERNLVGLAGVVVERIGGTLGGEDVPGDESKAFEMIPVFTPFQFMGAAGCPGVPGPR